MKTPNDREFGDETPLTIALLGTRGIPNHYGGFEQFAEQFAIRMAGKGHLIFVYTPHHHPYKSEEYQGVQLIRCYDPERKIGAVGQFVYDLNCILDSRKRNVDVLVQLGYTSSSIWSRLFPKRPLLVTNMDGLEWKRAKYNRLTQSFLRYAERLAVRRSNHLIADSIAIREYLEKKYNVSACYVPYGAHLFEPREAVAESLFDFSCKPFAYDLVIARFEPENNLETILRAYADYPDATLLLIGDAQANTFGKKCLARYGAYPHIRFVGAVFNHALLNTLRYYSRLYLHGHSVGGTNPSLLEAMACRGLIAAHDNVFNRSVLQDNAFYFQTSDDIVALLGQQPDKRNFNERLEKNLAKIQREYRWEKITETLSNYFQTWVASAKS